MARNDTPDNEFDTEVERILREHFDSEAPGLRSPNDPWPWLESRLEEPDPSSFFSRLLGSLNPLRGFRLSPAFAGAGVAVIAVAVAATVWAVSGDGGSEPTGGIAAISATQAPASTSLPTEAPPVPSEPRPEEQRSTAQPQSGPSPEGEDSTPESESAASLAVPVPTPSPSPLDATPESQVPVSTPSPVSTAMSRLVIVEDETMEEAEADSQAALGAPVPTPAILMYSTAVPSPRATAASQSTGTSGALGFPPPPQSTAVPGYGGSPPATTFRDYQRQPFLAASEDNVSTFSLDTDRTSYHLALNWARSSYEVHPDSVRAEEWINAFDYGYPPPSGDRNFSISSGIFPHPLDDDKALARIAFKAPELVDDKPLNVTLVLDASGSMADGNRVDIARQAAESIRRSLRPNDRIAVVHFTDNVIDGYTVAHKSPDDNRVKDSISWLQPHGSTNVQAGLNLGVRLASEVREMRPNAYNYVILMSDGVANVDATDPFAILETAYDPDARNPLRLITIGVGINNYNDPLLEVLAQHGNGWYRYLSSTTQAEATFARDNWLALSIPFADQTRAQVTWNADVVERWRIIGYENRVTSDESFTQDRKEFAEIYSGASTTVFYELELVEGWQPGPVWPLENIELRWVDPDTGDSMSQPNRSPIALAGLASDTDLDDHPMVHFGAIVALAADLYSVLPNAPEDAREDAGQGVFDGLTALLEQLRSLRGDLGALDSYTDFLFLLEYLTNGVEERLPPSTPSGYSR